jgi:methyl-accepting chemotaxis protein-1 (serine sensor receptor)
MTIKLRLGLTVGVACALLIVVGLFGMNAVSRSNQSLRRVYRRELKPSQTLAGAIEKVQSNRIALMSAHANPQPAIISATAKKLENNRAAVDAMLKQFAASHPGAKQQKGLARLKADRARLAGAIERDMDALNAQDLSTAKMLETMKVAPAFAPVQDDIGKLIDLKVQEAGALYSGAKARYRQLTLIGWIVIGLGVLFSATLGFFVVRGITRSLARAVGIADRIADGRLNNHIEIQSDDEAGRLLRALRTMDARLAEIVGDVRAGAESVGSAARQISEGNDDLSQRTQEQASSLEETASSMEEMTATVRQNADNAREASQLATGAREQAEKGGAVVTEAVGAMGEINAASEKIADIIGVIDEIAFQTNLLALNAAVEAARAGEQGRGFAVVASEVRNLAQRSASAAREIKGLISDSVGKVKNGSALVDESGRALGEIVDSVKKVTDIVAEIAAASQEQSAGIDQVNNAVAQMDEVTQQNAALVEEAASASRAMEEQAVGLNRQMAFFDASQSVSFAAAPKSIYVEPARERSAPVAQPPAAEPPAPRRLNGSDPANALTAARVANPGEERDVWQEF